MEFSAEHFLDHVSLPGMYLSELRVQNVGGILDETFGFKQGVNLIADVNSELGRNVGVEGKLIVQAIKALLTAAWHHDGAEESSFDFTPGRRGGMPARVTGIFRERDRGSDAEALQFTLCVSKCSDSLLFTVDESPKLFSEVCTLFADHFLHRASVINLSTTIFHNRSLPISFFWDELNRVKTLDMIKKNNVFLESESKLFDAMDLMEYTEIAGKRTQLEAEHIVNPHNDNLGLLERRDQLARLARYTKLKKLNDRAHDLREKIADQRAQIRREEQSELEKQTAEIEKLMARLLLDLGPSDEPGSVEASKITLKGTLEQLKRELEEKRRELSSLQPAIDDLEQLRARERQLADDLAENKSQLILLQNSLANVEVNRRQVAARIEAIRGKGIGEDCMRLASDTLTLRITQLEGEYMNVNSHHWSLDEELARKRARLEEISMEVNEIDKKFEAREKSLLELIKNELIEEHARNRKKDAMLSGRTYENLESKMNERLNRNHLKVIEAITSILRGFNVEPKDSEWRNFGYFGAVIDHIHVEPRFRGILRPLRKLLATLLVRDKEVAWLLREEIRKLKFEDRVNFICINDYDRAPSNISAPRGTKPLSSYLNTQVVHRYDLTVEQLERLDNILACELEKYFVIEGVGTQASNLAKSLAKLPQWESCIFVIQDGTCFGENAERCHGENGDPLTPYELLWDYWNAKQGELKYRFDQLMRTTEECEDARLETQAFLEQTRERLYEISNLRADIRFLQRAKKNLAGEKEMISAQIDHFTQQATELQMEDRSGSPNAYELKLESLSKYLDDEIDKLSAEIHLLDDSISESIIELAGTYVHFVACEGKDRKVLQLQADISWIETQITETELFLERCEELGNETEEEPVDPEPKRNPWCTPNTPLYESRIFLLEQKLAAVQRKLQEIEGEAGRDHWHPHTDYAKLLRDEERQARRLNILPISESLLSELQDVSRNDPWTEKRISIPEEVLEELSDVSQESHLLPSLEKDTMKFVLELFEKTVLESNPGSRVRILGFNENTANTNRRRDLRSRAPILEQDLVETVFEGVPARGSLSGEQKSLLLISALISRAALHTPRVLLVDESDVSLSSLPPSLQTRFFEEFVPECQMFILSQDGSERSYPVHNRIGFEQEPSEPRGSAPPSTSSSLLSIPSDAFQSARTSLNTSVSLSIT